MGRVRARSGAGGRCAPLIPSPLFPVNLWKIYKAVEKLGAYELVSSRGAPMGVVWHPKGVWAGVNPSPPQVTGRRLWKNVYDELGGSPGSTSAATCTRRHYER